MFLVTIIAGKRGNEFIDSMEFATQEVHPRTQTLLYSGFPELNYDDLLDSIAAIIDQAGNPWPSAPGRYDDEWVIISIKEIQVIPNAQLLIRLPTGYELQSNTPLDAACVKHVEEKIREANYPEGPSWHAC